MRNIKTENIKDSKLRPLNMSLECYEFLMLITQPDKLDYTASKAEFIRNNVLEDLRERIRYAYNKCRY